MATKVPAPGDTTARLYLWLVFVSPILLLILGIGLVIFGVERDSEGVATIGALGVVVSLILPRMKGPFEFGPKGFKGGLWDELFEEFVRRGFPSAEASEIAAEEAAVAIQAAGRGELTWEQVLRTPSPFAASVAARRIGDARAHERAVREIVERVANERSWRIREDMTIAVRGDAPPWTRVDFVVETDDGLVLIEAAVLTTVGNRPVMLRHFFGRARERSGARAAFLVVPDSSELVSEESEGVQLVKISELEGALRAFGAT